ncbi:hypothetical protein [Burkholderia stagnalis]
MIQFLFRKKLIVADFAGNAVIFGFQRLFTRILEIKHQVASLFLECGILQPSPFCRSVARLAATCSHATGRRTLHLQSRLDLPMLGMLILALSAAQTALLGNPT